VRSTHPSLPCFFEPTSVTGTKILVFPGACCRYVDSLFCITSRQHRPWGEKTTGKQAGIDDSGDPLWALFLRNRVRDNTLGTPGPRQARSKFFFPAPHIDLTSTPIGGSMKVQLTTPTRRMSSRPQPMACLPANPTHGVSYMTYSRSTKNLALRRDQ